MYRIPCAIEYIPDGSAPACILTLPRAELSRFISCVERIKEGSYRGVELAGKDKTVCRVGCEGDLLTFAFADVTLRLDQNQDEVLCLFLTEMTAAAPRYDHVDLEIRTEEGNCDLTVRVERKIGVYRWVSP